MRRHLGKIKRSAIAGFYILRRIGTKRVLLYTDSRGDNIPTHTEYPHYGALLAQRYHVRSYLCPEKWTTTLDFLALLPQMNPIDYDVVILHTGVVDASPRHQKIARDTIYPSKKAIYDVVFGADTMKKHLQSDLSCEYESDKTINMYSLDMAEVCLLPRLLQIPNLLWISGNRIVPGWRVEYWKDRPANIALVEKYFELFLQKLPHTVDLMRWSYQEVQARTFENIHLNRAGSDWVYNRVVEWLRKN